MTQETALKILKTGVNVFLTGEPGSGKTHTINKYIEYLKIMGIMPAITASTGIAATHIGGYTIHSWSGLGIKKVINEYELDRIATTERLAKRIEKAKVLIIDEISMLDGSVLNSIDLILQTVKRKRESFGGIQVIFVGDFFQLPPISKWGEEVPSFAFESEAWKGASPLVCYLSEQHRQSDQTFVGVLSALRSGSMSEEFLSHLTKRKTEYSEDKHSHTTKLFPHNEDVDRINLLELSKIEEEERNFIMTGRGKELLLLQLKKGALSPETLALKKGAMVMFTKNNLEEGFANGTTGVVDGFEKAGGFPIVKTKSGKSIVAKPMSWSVEDEGKVLAEITQVPLRLAWAITVHKSQGMSLDAAFMDLSNAFVPGQGYVALSRVRTLSGLFILGWNNVALSVDEDVLQKDKQFKEMSIFTEAEFIKLDEKELLESHKRFIERSGGAWREEKDISYSKAKVFEKKSTSEITLELLRSGKSIDDICKIRKLKEGTVYDHLYSLASKDKLREEDIKHLIPEDQKSKEEIKTIHTAFKKVGKDTLKPVFEYFEGAYSYDQIRLARILYTKD